MSFDFADLGAFLLGSTLTYIGNRYGFGFTGGGRSRKRAPSDRHVSKGQDHLPQGGNDEKPANPDQGSLTRL